MEKLTYETVVSLSYLSINLANKDKEGKALGISMAYDENHKILPESIKKALFLVLNKNFDFKKYFLKELDLNELRALIYAYIFSKIQKGKKVSLNKAKKKYIKLESKLKKRSA